MGGDGYLSSLENWREMAMPWVGMDAIVVGMGKVIVETLVENKSCLSVADI
jgi:hypothetical protein